MSRLTSFSVVTVAALAVTWSTGCSDSTGSNANQAIAVSIVSGASTMGNQAYQPNPATVSLSAAEQGRVRWTNNDGTTHTVTENTGLFDDDDVQSGDTFEFQFTTVGNYAYHCDIHPTMVAAISVVP